MLDTRQRKERELAEREQQILAIARDQILGEGYHGLNMDRIAARLGYSKGTIYNHFSCKEEIVIALALETMEKRVELMRRASGFKGSTRERLAAVGVAAGLFMQLYSDHFKFEQILRLDSIWEKTTEKRRSSIRNCESSCMHVVAGIVRDAVSRDEVALPPDTTAEDLVFGLWAMTFGTYSIMSTSDSLDELGIKNPQRIMNHHIDMVLDGYCWKPLSTEKPSDEIRERVINEVFADEYRQLQSVS